MDDNTNNPVVQNTANQPIQEAATPPMQSVPAAQPSVGNTAPAEGAKLTLNDLYGPSRPGELQQAAQPPIPPQPPAPEQPAMPAQLPVPERPVVPEPQPPLPPVPEEPVRRMPDPPSVPQENQPLPQAVVTMPQEKPAESEKSPYGGGGFRLPSILRFVVGGLILLFIAAIVWGISSFFFSGSKGGSSNGKVELVYWGLWEDQNVMQPVLDEFHQQHPNVTVTYVRQDPKDYTKRLLTRMQDGSGPDIFRIHNSWVYPLQSVLLPLPTSVIDAKQVEANYPPVVGNDLVSNGAVYGLPLQMDTLSLFVNTDIFTHAGATVPTTWDNFITVAKALTVKDPNGYIQTAGAALGTYDNIAHAPDIVSLLLLQNGANLGKLNSTTTNVSDALSFYTSFAKGDGNVWDNTLDNSLLAFERGKLAMYFGYSYDIFAIQAASPNLKFSIYPVPHLPGRTIDIASYWAEAVSNRSKHQKEALEFMQFLAQKDTQTKLYTEETKTRSFGELYARTDLAKDLTQNSLLKPFVDQFADAQSSFFAADTDYDEYNGALNQYLGNAINSILKDTSASSATDTLIKGVEQVLQTFSSKTQ